MIAFDELGVPRLIGDIPNADTLDVDAIPLDRRAVLVYHRRRGWQLFIGENRRPKIESGSLTAIATVRRQACVVIVDRCTIVEGEE